MTKFKKQFLLIYLIMFSLILLSTEMAKQVLIWLSLIRIVFNFNGLHLFAHRMVLFRLFAHLFINHNLWGLSCKRVYQLLFCLVSFMYKYRHLITLKDYYRYMTCLINLHACLLITWLLCLRCIHYTPYVHTKWMASNLV